MRPLAIGQPSLWSVEERLRWTLRALTEVERASHQVDDRMSLVAVLKVLGYAPRIARVSTTDATETTLDTIPADAETTTMVEGHVVARRTGGAAGTAEDGASYSLHGTFKNVAGTATLIGSATYVAHEDQSAWDAAFDVTGSSIRIRVTGAADNNIDWKSVCRVIKV